MEANNNLFDCRPLGFQSESLSKTLLDKAVGVYNDLPYKGTKYNITKDQPPLERTQVHVCQYDLSKEKDRQEYERICNIISGPGGEVSYEEKIYDNDIKSWRIMLRWIEHFYTAPKNLKKDEII